MRSLLCTLGLAAALLVAGPAHAQFGNTNLGLSLGYMSFNRTAGLDSGFMVGLEFFRHTDIMGLEWGSLTKVSFPLDPVSNTRVIAVAPSIGARYLFLQELVRPYAGLDVSFLSVFKPQGLIYYAGFGANVGLDVFVSSEVSIGARVQGNLYAMLNRDTQTSLIFSVGSAVNF